MLFTTLSCFSFISSAQMKAFKPVYEMNTSLSQISGYIDMLYACNQLLLRNNRF